MSKTHLTEQKFSDFALHPAVIEALEKKGFHNCTPIQALALPLTLEGRDVAGQAQTGTGKTMAFLTSTFHYLLSHPAIADRQVNQPRALIMAPTRELAVQIHADAEPLAQATGLKLGLAYGGDGYDKQLKVLESGVDILIGTTGRLIDYAKQNHINLGAIQVVVLDEADRMYDLGFIKDIRWLFRRMPPATQRLNMLFSATLSYRVRELAFEQMNNAEYVEVEPEQKTGHRIKEELFYPSNEEKMRLLQTLLEEEWPDRAIVFANTKHRCEDIWGHLAADGHRVGLLTGDVAQKKRLRILEEFTRGDLDILVATDVAARGLHIPAVTHVFNYDLPDDCEDYVHRIGRTARANRDGRAITFVSEEDQYWFQQIEKFLEKVVDKMPLPEGCGEGPEYIKLNKPKKKGANGRNNRRGNGGNGEAGKNSAKNRRQKDRDQTSHKRKPNKPNERQEKAPRNNEQQPQQGNRQQNAKQQPQQGNRQQNAKQQPQQGNRQQNAKQQNRKPAQPGEQPKNSNSQKRRNNSNNSNQQRPGNENNVRPGSNGRGRGVAQKKGDKPAARKHTPIVNPQKQENAVKKFIKRIFGFKK